MAAGLLPAERTRCLQSGPHHRDGADALGGGGRCAGAAGPNADGAARAVSGAPCLALGQMVGYHELFPSPMDGVSSVLHRQRVCSRWALDRTLRVHLLRHPWEHTWSVSVRSMQLIPDINFTSIGLLGQCWKESAGVAQGWWRRAWRIARDVFRASGRMCALCKSYSLMLKLLPACILLQTAKLVSIFPTHFTF